MDLTSTSFSLFLVLLVSLLLLKKNRSGGGARATLPPGPSKLPIIGSLHHLLGGLPHRSLTALSKKFGPVILLKLGEVPTLVVSSTEAAAEIMKTHDVSFASRPTNLNLQTATYGDRGVGFTSYGFHWRELRKMSIVELLSAKRVQSFRFIREEEVLNLVRSIVLLSNAGSTVNLSKKLVLLANDIGSRSVIGSKCKYQKEFIRIVMQTLEAAGGFSLADLFPSWPIIKLLSGATFKMQMLHRDMDAILNSIIQERRERKSAEQPEEEEEEEALVDVMLRVQAEGSLSFPLADEDMKAMMLDMLGGASETSAGIMEWAMSELMRNPRVMRKLQEEVRETVGEKGKVTEKDINGMNYLKLVIKETLRLHPPVPLLLPRECRETCEVLGYQIPEKTRVFVNVWALGRDPRYWDSPTEFEPEIREQEFHGRLQGTNFEFLPFGAGRRICPGMSFGLKSIELSLASLLYNFDWELPSGNEGMPQELDMSETFSITCRRKSDLCLRAILVFLSP
ncbi:unnamed protein product [Musa acuminata subsp. burmannicoides]